jgi:predicted amidohydrolase YtcJ
VTRRLLTGATVWAGADCAPRSAWLLIEDEALAAVGERGQPPPDGQALDLSGHHILPGFVDVHLHLSQAAWFPRGGDALGWRGLADALRAVRVAADAGAGADELDSLVAARRPAAAAEPFLTLMGTPPQVPEQMKRWIQARSR